MSKMPIMRTRTFKLAEGAVKGGREVNLFFKNMYKYYFPPYLVIQRKGIINQNYQQFDINQYAIDQNKIPVNHWYISTFLGCLFCGYYVAFSLYDQDLRYYLYVRFPEYMLTYDENVKQIQEFYSQIQLKYIGEIPEIHSESDLYQVKEYIKDKIFKTELKKAEENWLRGELKESVKDYDKEIGQIDNIINSQEMDLKRIQHNKE